MKLSIHIRLDNNVDFIICPAISFLLCISPPQYRFFIVHFRVYSVLRERERGVAKTHLACVGELPLDQIDIDCPMRALLSLSLSLAIPRVIREIISHPFYLETFR